MTVKIKRPSSTHGPGRQTASKMIGRLVMLSVLMLALLGTAITIFLSGGDTSSEQFLPVRDRMTLYHEVKQGDYPPGRRVMSVTPTMEGSDAPMPAIEQDLDPEERNLPVKFSKAALEQPQPGEAKPSVYERALKEVLEAGGELSPGLAAQAKAIDALPHAAAFDPGVEVREDTYDFPGPSGSVNEHLKREWKAERDSAVRASGEERLVLRPFHSETSQIAFGNLVKAVSAADAAKLVAADNGSRFMHYDLPETVTAARGRVFTVEGTLWMLRELPLQDPVTIDGQTVKSAYYGIIALLRDGLGYERAREHDCVSFTALTLPASLRQFALRPDQAVSPGDALATGTVGVRVRGAWFRRIAFREPVGTLRVEKREKDDKGRDKISFVDERYLAEAYMPWLICRDAEQATVTLPDAASIRAVVNQFAEANTPVKADQRDNFDEAGYYLLLSTLRAEKNPLAGLPRAELNYRMMLTPELRDQYRGASVATKGILMDTYHPLVLRPNISGLRLMYRAFVADARNKNEVDSERMWYVDMIEPPLSFTGSPQVTVEGQYYRSQLLKVEIKGRVAIPAYPLVLTTKIASSEGGGGAIVGARADSKTVYLIIGLCTLGVIGLIVFMSWRDKRKRAQFEIAAMRRASPRKPLPGAAGADVSGVSAVKPPSGEESGK